MLASQKIDQQRPQLISTLLGCLLIVAATSMASVLIGLLGVSEMVGIWLAVSLFSLNLAPRLPRWQDRLPLQLGFTLTIQSTVLFIGLV